MFSLADMKTIPTEKVTAFLMDELHTERFTEMPRLYAVAYAIVQGDRGADLTTIDTFLPSVQDDELRGFLDTALRGQWDAVIRAREAFDPAMYAAFLLYDRHVIDYAHENETPDSVIRLALRLLDIAPGHHVADFCTGRGAFLRECAIQTDAATLYGNEVDPIYRAIAKMRAALLPHTFIAKEDVLEIEPDRHRFDRIFSNYPFALRVQDMDRAKNTALQYLNRHLTTVKKSMTGDWYFNTAILNCLAEHGRAVAVTVNGCMWNGADREVRRFFLESGFIEAVIALPSRLFEQTNIPTTMLVLSRGNTQTTFVDASDIFTKGRRQNTLSDADIDKIMVRLHAPGQRSAVLTQADVAAKDYLLSAERILDAQNTVRPTNSVPLGTVLHRMTRGAQLKADALDAITTEAATPYRFLMLADIRGGMIAEELVHLTGIERRLEKYCVRDKALIIAKNGSPIKTAVAEVPAGEMLLAGGNLYILELDEDKMDPYFLKAYLDSPQGAAAIKSLCVGVTIPNIPIESLRAMPVPLPPMEEQKRIAEVYRQTVKKIRKKQKELDDLSEKLTTLYDL
ncbi:MAG: N-6 DNA methylase [Oscillospiraceae bacterium]|nr:N-6 DNA methylase [Oscillospiraceae bacterium]